MEKNSIGQLSKTAQEAQAKLFEGNCELITQQMEANEAQIREYQAQRDKLQAGTTSDSKSVVVGLQDDYSDRAGIPRAPVAPPTDGNDDSDYWTSITLEVSSSFANEKTDSSSMSWSAGGSVSWGFFSASASASHSEAQSNVSRQLSNASVKVSFECMRVDISRPWLRGEIFYDHDLRVAPGE